MELRRRTWLAAVQLAAIVSIVAVVLALAVSTVGDVPQAVVILPVIIVAFVTSWIRTGRVRREFARPVVLTQRPGVPLA